MLVEKPQLRAVKTRDLRRVAESFLHPLFFPRNFSHPARINSYYHRLSGVAHEMRLWRIPEQQVIGAREEASLRDDWVRDFVRSFLHKRVATMSCPLLLDYWEWIFATFDLLAFLGYSPL